MAIGPRPWADPALGQVQDALVDGRGGTIFALLEAAHEGALAGEVEQERHAIACEEEGWVGLPGGSVVPLGFDEGCGLRPTIGLVAPELAGERGGDAEVGVDPLLGRETRLCEPPRRPLEPEGAPVAADDCRQGADLGDLRRGERGREGLPDLVWQRAAMDCEEPEDLALRAGQGRPDGVEESVLATDPDTRSIRAFQHVRREPPQLTLRIPTDGAHLLAAHVRIPVDRP
ncbi:hypothetical protein WMF31_35240 [Sorangium sp. So ce1036]|uniref:hypothetical protein n=1 Tax=Sorangium sp. So ce1036 TaxID=3133328 RepID=UPI003F066DB5